ncbi:HAD family hydrolase [Aciduricibacillus chroicocephali]|uniref:Phosphoserine phosphatase n=1 Tax=Aciduricibacillus chroicocephali TaxID=3054939 RepID=A0ABY9KYY9_9BACI|nr:HAD family hydrolase [Bacillaceae bacterium 44XB]
MRPKAIFFDLDDTLLWDKQSIAKAFEETCKLAETKYGIPKKKLEIETRRAASELYASYETYPHTKNIGINPFEGMWGDFDDAGDAFQLMKKLMPHYRKAAWYEGLKACGIHDMEFAETLSEAFPEARKKHPYLYEETLDVLEKLQGEYELVLLTNGSPSLQQKKLELTPELRPFFKAIIISGDIGKGKPDRKMFEKALQEVDLKPNEVWMVGDNMLTDIIGANEMGIYAVWINHECKPTDGAKPDATISRLGELLDLLKGLE